jgi:antitoxin component of RelBE/YafQ-DinJ toxin-antitoxin module
MKNKILNVRIESDLEEKFREHCKKNGYSISKRIRILMKNDIDKNN